MTDIEASWGIILVREIDRCRNGGWSIVWEESGISNLVGETVLGIHIDDDVRLGDVVYIWVKDYVYRLFHYPDCCERVDLVEGGDELGGLVGEQLLIAREDVSDYMEDSRIEYAPMEGSDESYTWTFYTFCTGRGCIVLRWYGSSNGYYSEEVSVERSRIATGRYPLRGFHRGFGEVSALQDE